MSQPDRTQARAGTPGFVFPQEAEDALARGEMLEAIRVLRQANRHIDLATARQAIESYAASVRTAPAKARQDVPRTPRVPTVVEGDRGGYRSLVVLALAILAAAAWWWVSGAG